MSEEQVIREGDAGLRVLVIGAHSDDIEIGCGGLLHALAARSHRPVAALKACLFTGSPARHEEARASFEVYRQAFAGQNPDLDVTLECHDLPDGRLPDHLGRIKEIHSGLRAFQPDLVLTHQPGDAHQDHRTLADVAGQTFRSAEAFVLGYEIPKWDGDLGRPTYYVPLADAELDRKCQQLMAHFGSQRSKAWFDEETFRGLARIRGVECGHRYAEAFYVRRMIATQPSLLAPV